MSSRGHESEDSMREENRKHERTTTGRKSRGNASKKGKRRMVPKRVPTAPALPETSLPPTPLADAIEAPSIPALPAETPGMRRGLLAVIAFVMVAICGVALLRACEPKEPTNEDDTAEAAACSDDAALCVARA